MFAGLIKVNEYIAEVKFDYYEVAIILIDIVRYAALICSIFFGVLGVILRVARMKVEYFMLTDRRIYGTQGLFTKKTLDIMLDKVDTIRINSTLFGRLLKYYTIEVISPSSSMMIQGTTVNPTLRFVKNAEEFRTKVITTIEELKAKVRQG